MNQLFVLLATVVLGTILGFGAYPILNKTKDTGKTSLVNTEIQSIRTSAALWLVKDSDGTFTNVSVANLTTYLPGMTVTGGKFVSKADPSISYDISVKTGDSSEFTVTASGLSIITGGETSIKNTQSSITSNIADTSTTDGILALDYRG